MEISEREGSAAAHAHASSAQWVAQALRRQRRGQHAQPPSVALTPAGALHNNPGDASCNRPASPTQAGTTPSRSETPLGTWRCTGLSRGTTAPGVGAELGRCGGGGRRGGRPAPRWLDVTKAYQKSILWLGDSYTHPLVTIKPTNVFLGKGQQNRRGAGSPPSSWDLDGGWGGGAAPRSFDHQIRAHHQVHCIQGPSLSRNLKSEE